MRPLILLLACVLCILSCDSPKSSSSSLTKYIPRKTSVVLKTHDIEALRTTLTNNEFVSKLTPTLFYSFIKEQEVLLEGIELQGETLFCFTKIGKDDFEVSLISKMHAKFWGADSTSQKGSKPKSIQKITRDNGVFYALEHEGTAILSTSQLLLENILRDDQDTQDAYFERAYKTTSKKAQASILINGSEAHDLWRDLFPNSGVSPLKDTFTWTAADVESDQNDLKLSGITLVKDSTNLRLNLLRNTQARSNQIANFTPTAAQSVTAITYSDWANFKANQALFKRLDLAKFNMQDEDLLATFDEIGVIRLSTGSVIAAFSPDITLTEEMLTGTEEVASFRKVAINSYKDGTAFAKAYAPLLSMPQLKMYSILENTVLFAENQQSLETVIANYQSKATLGQSTIYKNIANQMSSASSMMHVENIKTEQYKSWPSEKGQKVWKNIALDGYNFLATQWVQERDFLHFNVILTKNEEGNKQGSIAQIANVKLNSPIAKSPQLVKNHRSKGKDIVVQDMNHVLYQISNTGKVLWQQELDSPILGDIQQVDLYRNGRLQLAFTTESAFHILDRNGKEVAPFPITFSDAVTQPLAIFDYENNRNYRFVITQGANLNMYDKEAKSVTGFKFKKAASEIILPPKHIRIANKDYIVLADNSNTLNILSRTGTSRIDVKEEILFGDQPISRKNNSFETYNINGEKVTIDIKGKVTRNATGLSSDSNITTYNKGVISLRENKLNFNGKEVSLAYGSYTAPKRFVIKNKAYITVTNTESNEVHVFDSQGKLLENFPIYGTTAADMGLLQRNKQLGLVTQGDGSSILIYVLN